MEDFSKKPDRHESFYYKEIVVLVMTSDLTKFL